MQSLYNHYAITIQSLFSHFKITFLFAYFQLRLISRLVRFLRLGYHLHHLLLLIPQIPLELLVNHVEYYAFASIHVYLVLQLSVVGKEGRRSRDG
jgi:hypothetical protein